MEPLFIERPIYEEGEALECGKHDVDVSRFGPDSDQELDDIVTGLDAVECNITEGQEFPNFEDAFEHYVRYAKVHGFAVRKQRTFNRDWDDRGVYRKDFVCFKACSRQKKVNANGDNLHPTNERTHNDDDNIGGSNGNDALGNLVNENNGSENLQNYLQKHKSSKRTSKRCNCPAYMSVKEVKDEKELNVGVGGLPFNSRVAYNFLRVAKTIKKKNDADRLVLICKKLKETDNDFQYEYVINDDNRLKHIAWSHSASLYGYQHYGDVVVFDTTYRLNIYKMLQMRQLSPFNGHLRFFINFMGEKAPQTIITDQDRAIRDAIQIVLPSTKHVLCMWHLGKKIPSWVGLRLGAKLNEFHDVFHKLNELEIVEEFEIQWTCMLENYSLSSNKRMEKVYKNRKQWAKPYLKAYFFAGMRTSNRCESMNVAIKKYVKSQTLLQDFIGQIGRAVELLDQAGEHKTIQQKVNNINFLTKAPIENQAGKTLTPNCFEIPDQYLPHQWRRESCVALPPVRIGPEGRRERIDVLRLATTKLIKVAYMTKDRFNVAIEYINENITKLKGMACATNVEPVDDYEFHPTVSGRDGLNEEVGIDNEHKYVDNPLDCLTKGRLKDKRDRSWFEKSQMKPKKNLEKKQQTCGYCGVRGHNQKACALKLSQSQTIETMNEELSESVV
ncbi:protein FAR1-RELATED SEQUENCE 11-like [Telopea speciosissima]|uniref:protein FAR1-RELATED SEQUENCE 11-like n=1 Tax=Telopea speciosissima TaxID=54955 RepID=UPI001CC49E37|nr:protein FAR1-RELATED SEQUENCE 11-like [Telopea speciosissima]